MGKFPVHGQAHGEVAGETAHNIGDGLGEENSVYPKAYAGEEQGEGRRGYLRLLLGVR